VPLTPAFLVRLVGRVSSTLYEVPMVAYLAAAGMMAWIVGTDEIIGAVMMILHWTA
jgi:hypothetical protein